jgi:hypothetical protein
MTPYEKTLSEILVALVKEAGGEIVLTNEQISILPTEIVYIYNHDNGFLLQYKNNAVIEEV